MLLLNELPLEILQEIFDYVPAVDLWKNVRRVCRRMNLALHSNGFWLSRAQVVFFLLEN